MMKRTTHIFQEYMRGRLGEMLGEKVESLVRTLTRRTEYNLEVGRVDEL